MRLVISSFHVLLLGPVFSPHFGPRFGPAFAIHRRTC